MDYNVSVSRNSGEVLPPEQQRRARIEGFVAVVVMSVAVQFAFATIAYLMSGMAQYGYDASGVVVESIVAGGIFGLVVGAAYPATVRDAPQRGVIVGLAVWGCAILPWGVFDFPSSIADEPELLMRWIVEALLVPLPLAAMIAVDRTMRGGMGLIVGLMIGMTAGIVPYALELAWAMYAYRDMMSAGFDFLEYLRYSVDLGLYSLIQNLHLPAMFVGGWALARGREQIMVKRAIESGTAVPV